jgi:hypothetical protein
MKPAIALAALLGAALSEEKPMIIFNFDADLPGQPPKGFELALTGKGNPGKWVVQTVDDAPSGKNVLAQVLNAKARWRTRAFALLVRRG